MAKAIKFTDDELKQITDLRDASQAKIIEFGQIKLDILLTTQQLTRLGDLEKAAEKSYIDLQSRELELVNKLKEKYGVGTVDIASGEFIPAK